MSDFYLGNGSKRPKRQDYIDKWGWQGQTIYTLDKIRYEQKQQELKRYKETQKKASAYAKKRWG